MPFHTHTLPNGLQIIGETNPAALCAAVAFWVRTGSRDETPACCKLGGWICADGICQPQACPDDRRW